MNDKRKLKPFRFWVQKTLPLIYDDSLSYYEILCKFTKYINTLLSQTDILRDSIIELEEYVTHYFDNLDVQEEINNKLDAMAEAGEFSNIINRIIELNQHMTADYESIISPNISTYDFTTFDGDYHRLMAKYPEEEHKIKYRTIGESVLGRPLYAIEVGRSVESDPYGKVLVLGNQHGREITSSQQLMKTVEYLMQNWDNFFIHDYLKKRVRDYFEDLSIVFIPMTNPDCAELVINGFESIPNDYPNRSTLINNIKQAVVNHCREGKINRGEVPSDWDLLWSTVWGTTYGTIANYNFREKDLFFFQSNMEGVDLHYNWWLPEINGSLLDDYMATSTHYTKGIFSTEFDIGNVGCGAKENRYIYERYFLNGYNKYGMTFHTKSPLLQGIYSIKDTYLMNRMDTVLSDLSCHTFTNRNKDNAIHNPFGFSGFLQYYNFKNSNTNDCASVVAEIGFQYMNQYPNSKQNITTGYGPDYIGWQQPDVKEPLIWELTKDLVPIFSFIYATRIDKFHNPYNTINSYVQYPSQENLVLYQEDDTGTYVAGGYTYKNASISREGNHVYVKGHIQLTSKGQLQDDLPLLIRCATTKNLPANNTGEVVYGQVAYFAYYDTTEMAHYTTPFIIFDKTKQNLRLMCINTNNGIAYPVTGKMIKGTFRFGFSLDYYSRLMHGQ